MKILVLLASVFICTNSFANCTTTVRGRTVCNNGQEAGGYNRSSGTAWKSEKNQAGVTTTQTSKGGEAKTRNGKGVYKSPNGKTCVKTASNQGCN
jgi:hypothetical protein